MNLEGIDDFDLKGVLFAYYPMDLSWDEARERLEMDIDETASQLDSENPSISPFWIFMTMHRLAQEELSDLRKNNIEKYKQMLADAIKSRKQIFKENLSKQHHTTGN